MTQCKLIFSGKTTICETHDWVFIGMPSLHCPIGRIEETAEKAIAKIRAEGERYADVPAQR